MTSQWVLETPKSPKLLKKHCLMPLPSLAAIAIREGTFQQGGGKHPPAMLDQKKPGRIRVKQYPVLEFLQTKLGPGGGYFTLGKTGMCASFG